MAHYLVTARPRDELLYELERRLAAGEFEEMRPFGRSLSAGLRGARLKDDETAVWEEEDYCSPPLAQERAEVLDRYFEGIEVEAVEEGEGWKRIEKLPRLLPAF